MAFTGDKEPRLLKEPEELLELEEPLELEELLLEEEPLELEDPLLLEEPLELEEPLLLEEPLELEEDPLELELFDRGLAAAAPKRFDPVGEPASSGVISPGTLSLAFPGSWIRALVPLCLNGAGFSSAASCC